MNTCFDTMCIRTGVQVFKIKPASTLLGFKLYMPVLVRADKLAIKSMKSSAIGPFF